MTDTFKSYTVSIRGVEVFTIELLDERPTGFSVCVPELAIYTFGKTEDQAIERVLAHVLEKYQDLLDSPIPLNENEQRFLELYRTTIIPALVEENLRRPPKLSFWQRLGNLVRGGDSWRAGFLESLKISLRPSGS